MMKNQLKVKRVINNNIVIAENFKGQEVVAIGKGLGFKKDKHDIISENEISKTFISLDNQKMWIEKLLSYIGAKRFNTFESLTKNGYSLEATVRKLKEIYED